MSRTPRTIRLNSLLRSDTFRLPNDPSGRVHGPVGSVVNWGHEACSVYFADGTQYRPYEYIHGWTVVELVGRLDDCVHGVHPDRCEEACWAL